MSYQLAFWSTDANDDPSRIYKRVMDGGADDAGLDVLDVAAIERSLIDTFIGATVDARLSDGNSQTALSVPNGVSFDVAWTFYSVVCTAYGATGDDLNTVIDVMQRYGLPLYDPQTGERFGSVQRS